MKTIGFHCAILVLVFMALDCGQAVTPPAHAETSVYTQRLNGEDTIRGNQIYAQQWKLPADMEPDGLRTENFLALSPDGEYRLIKTMVCDGVHRFSLAFDFSGAYEMDDASVTLSPSRSVTACIAWGTMDQRFPGESGIFTGSDSMAFRRAFNSPFLGEDIGNNEMYIVLDNMSMTFEIAGNAPSQSRYRLINLNAKNGGLTIYGTLVLPAEYESGRLPVVIFAHGFAGNGMVSQDIAYMMAEYGIASYCFDFCGGSLTSRSDGSFYEMSMPTEVQDLHAVIDLIREQPFTDLDNLYVFGESMGGAVAALAAAQRPRGDIRGLLHFYPAFSISEQTRALYPSAEDIPERAPTSAGISVARKFYADALKIDIYPEIALFTGPVLMFQGSLDTVVPSIYAQKALDYYENAELILYDGEGHGFSRAVKLKAVAKMIDFVLENKNKTVR